MRFTTRVRAFWATVAVVAVAGAAMTISLGLRSGPSVTLHPAGGFRVNGEYASTGAESLAGPRYGSWSGSDGNTGRLTSEPFEVGTAVAFWLSGYPSVTGNRIVIERTDGAAAIAATVPADPGEHWIRIIQPLPVTWIGRPVRVVATDAATGFHGWIGVGDVRRAGLATTVAGDVRFRLLGDVLLTILAGFPLLYGANALRRRMGLPRVFLFASFLLAAGAGAELVFFSTMANTAATAAAVVLVTLAAIATTVRALRDVRFRADIVHPDAWIPFGIAGASTVAYLGVLCVVLTPASSPIYDVSNWLHLADDNILPYVMSDHIAAHAPPKPFVREWLSSDRPPLQAGFDLSLRALTPFVHDPVARYVALSIVLQASALAMVFVLARIAGCRPLRSGAVVTLAFFSGFFLENTVFVWPKQLAAAYVMIAVAIALSPGKSWGPRAIGIGVALALGMLSHGGVAFTIPALLIAWLVTRRRAALKPSALVIGAFVALYSPWMIYQHFYDPPGDRLLKWHLAGHIAPTDEPFGSVLRAAYSVPPATILHNKLSNVAITLGGEGMAANPPLVREQLALRYALGALALPYLAALAWGYFNRSRAIRRAMGLAWIGAGGVLFWCAAMYGPGGGVIPNGSYANVTLLFAAGGIVATEWSLLYAIALIVQLVDLALVWLSTVHATAGIDVGSVPAVLAFTAAAGVALAIFRSARRHGAVTGV